MALRPERPIPHPPRAGRADVERWLADEPVTAYREPFPTRALRWARRHKTAVAGIAAIVGTGVVALAVSNILVARERDRTEAARVEADGNYILARKTIETMLDEVAAVDLADVPLMEPVRRKILNTALGFYHSFVAARGDDPALQLDIGRATSASATSSKGSATPGRPRGLIGRGSST